MELKKSEAKIGPEAGKPRPKGRVGTQGSMADSLRRQIQQLKTGRPPRSLNEFIESRMVEEKKHSSEG